jgi:hypothetical protein
LCIYTQFHPQNSMGLILRGRISPRHWWHTPVILATQEAGIKRIEVRSQPEQIVHETLSWKTLHKNRTGGVALSSSPNTTKKKKKDTGTCYVVQAGLKLMFFHPQSTE